MRKALILTPLLALVVAACGAALDRSDVVDTTLPNTVASLDGSMMMDNMMVTDMNSTEGMDTMTDNMMAVDAMSGTGVVPQYDYPSMMADPSTEMMASDTPEPDADDTDSMTDNMSPVGE